MYEEREKKVKKWTLSFPYFYFPFLCVCVCYFIIHFTWEIRKTREEKKSERVKKVYLVE